MQPSTWDIRNSVNIKVFDDQHRKASEILDDLQEAIVQKRERGVIDPLFDNLVAEVKEHFETEEKLMKSYSYPSYTLHKTMHDAFLKQLAKLQKNCREGKEQFSVENVGIMKHWFIDHILGADKLYTSFFNQKGVY